MPIAHPTHELNAHLVPPPMCMSACRPLTDSCAANREHATKVQHRQPPPSTTFKAHVTMLPLTLFSYENPRPATTNQALAPLCRVIYYAQYYFTPTPLLLDLVMLGQVRPLHRATLMCALKLSCWSSGTCSWATSTTLGFRHSDVGMEDHLTLTPFGDTPT